MSREAQCSKRAVVYRCFDSDGVLLYVGSSMAALSRIASHFYGSKWFDRTARIEIEHFASRREAIAAERRAIHGESPIFNEIHMKKKTRLPEGDEKTMKAWFSEAIGNAIRASDMTRSEVADISGCSEAAIRSWESGCCPSVINAHMLLSALGLRLVIGDPEGEDLE